MVALALTYAVMSFALVGAYRYIALRRSWLDHPNERSSHHRVIPRGAGIVFALLITGAALLHSADHTAIALSFLPVFAVALIGWRDDLHGLTATRRLALYCVCAAGIAIAVGAPTMEQPLPSYLTTTALGLIIVLTLAWLINLYNFMDGINGIAGGEAVFVLAAILWLSAESPFNAQLGPLLWLALCAIAGFLLWNFPIGRVFMGDAGSAYLGALMGLLIFWSTQLEGPSLYCWLILLGIFVVDTAFTLVVRAITGQRWYAAHRLHAYQLLSDRLHSHTRTVVVLSAINLLWLLPCAWFAHAGGWAGFTAIAVAYAPLFAGCCFLKAGFPQHRTV